LWIARAVYERVARELRRGNAVFILTGTGRPRRADAAAVDISLRLAVSGWDGANESSCAVRLLIDADADADGAVTGVLGALAEAACDRV
jgi:hypothetical protein